MRKTRIAVVVLTTILGSVAESPAQESTNEAVPVINEYFDLILDGNYEIASDMWTPEALERSGRFGITFAGIPIKPSTILIFSIAFGISVDDTIHFLAKYRQELATHNWRIRQSVYASLRETGVSMFYTSIVLFFGFSVFTISSFGGTVALGALVSATLLFAMLSNLILLPSLLLSLERNIANKEVLKEPQIDILTEAEESERRQQQSAEHGHCQQHHAEPASW